MAEFHKLRAVLAVLFMLLAFPAGAQSLIQGEVKGEQGRGFGRVILTFPTPVTATSTVAGGVLIIRFDRKVQLGADKLPVQLAPYISAVRLDPDQTSLRIALVQAVRADLKDAAEQLYLDLLPTSWRGAPPPLPADVAAKLAQRVRAAREMERIEPAAQPKVMAPVSVSVARTAGRMRLGFALPNGAGARSDVLQDRVSVVLDGGGQFDQAGVRAALSGFVEDVAFAEPGRLSFALPKGHSHAAGMDDGAFVMDFVAPEAAKPVRVPDPPRPAPEAPKAEAPVEAAPKIEIKPGMRQAVDVRLQPGKSMSLRITPKVPAAVYEKEGDIHIVLAGTRTVKVPSVSGKPSEGVTNLSGEQHDGWSAIHVTPLEKGLVSVLDDAEGWTITSRADGQGTQGVVKIDRMAQDDGRMVISAMMPQPFPAIWIDDPQSSDRYAVVPTLGPPHAVLAPQRFVEFALMKTALGVVIEARADDLFITPGKEGVRIGREGGLALSAKVAAQSAKAHVSMVFDADLWAQDRRGSVRETERELLNNAANSPKRERSAARLRLAGFYLANGMGREASGVLGVIALEDPKVAAGRQLMLKQGLALFMQDDMTGALKVLGEPALSLDTEATLLRAASDVRLRRGGAALQVFRTNDEALERLPGALQALVYPLAIDAALLAGDSYLAGQYLASLEQLDASERDPALVSLYQGRIAEAAGRHGEAMSAYAVAARIGSRPVEAEARLDRALLGQSTGLMPQDLARAELETVGMIWRRGPEEVRARTRLAELAAAEGRWRDAFLASRRAIEIMPEHPVTRALQDEMSRRFEALFLGGEADKLPKVEALAIFDEFRSLIPPGNKGDAIVRRLAERLADLDLIPQAAELMTHQVDYRLKGLPRAEAASRLALLHLIDGQPQEALSVLRASRHAAMPPDLKQARVQMEARALSDLSRTDLALEILGSEKGVEVERLRGDILWRGKRWAEAAETYERALETRWQDEGALEPGERGDVLRAAIAYVLASDKLGADRLRTKFMTKMADTPDGEMFRLVTIEHLTQPDAFRDAAKSAVSARTFGDFVAAYRKRFGGAAGG